MSVLSILAASTALAIDGRRLFEPHPHSAAGIGLSLLRAHGGRSPVPANLPGTMTNNEHDRQRERVALAKRERVRQRKVADAVRTRLGRHGAISLTAGRCSLCDAHTGDGFTTTMRVDEINVALCQHCANP